MPDPSVLLLVDVEGAPCPASASNVVFPEEPWWLLPAMRRSVRTQVGFLRVLSRRGCVLGIAHALTPISDNFVRRSTLDLSRRVGPGMVVVRGGRPVSASDPALLCQDFSAHVLETAGQASVWRGLQLSWSVLDGERGCEHVVVLRPCRSLAEPLFASLSRAHIETCEAAVAGLTAKEIARLRGCTVETIRSHLKVSYKRLGCALVSNWVRWWQSGIPGATCSERWQRPVPSAAHEWRMAWQCGIALLARSSHQRLSLKWGRRMRYVPSLEV